MLHLVSETDSMGLVLAKQIKNKKTQEQYLIFFFLFQHKKIIRSRAD